MQFSPCMQDIYLIFLNCEHHLYWFFFSTSTVSQIKLVDGNVQYQNDNNENSFSFILNLNRLSECRDLNGKMEVDRRRI